MPRRFLDISVAIDNDTPADPPPMRPAIHYKGHKEGALEIASIFPGLDPADLPDGEGWAVEDIRLTTHSGTHLDAPWHFHSTMDGGKSSTTIDQVPLEWCYSEGIKLDFRHLPDGHVVSPSDIEDELRRIEHTLRPLDIVLVNTAAGEAYGRPDYLGKGCGMGRDATLYLLERGVRVAGTDAWSWDAPFSVTRSRFEQSRDPAIIWEGHKAGREIGYCHLEKLTNLAALPDKGFFVSCFPVKIKAASAGWTRAVAIIEE